MIYRGYMCFGENKILRDMFQHCIKKISSFSGSLVFPISLQCNSSLSDLCTKPGIKFSQI